MKKTRAPRSRLTRTITRLSATVALASACVGCGEKPRPKAPDVSRVEAGPGSAALPLPPVPPPTARTVGGVELTALVPEGAVGDAIIAAARDLSHDKKAAARLIAAGPAARPVVLALLSSANLDEVLGALEAFGATGDPVGLKEEAGKALEGLIGLLGHEVREVRDRAWQVAPLVADGDGLVELLDKAGSDEVARGLLGLLANWDGPSVRAALDKIARGPKAALAEEAVFALVARGREGEAERIALAVDLLGQADKRGLGLRLAASLGEAAMKPHAKVLSGLIETVLTHKATEPAEVVAAAIRATRSLPKTDHVPLLTQLAADALTEVRRVAIETLGEVTEPRDEVFASVEKALDDLEGSVRIAAIRAYAGLSRRVPKRPLEAAVSKLAPKLAEPHQGVRLAAASVLARPEFAPWSAGPLAQRVDAEKEGARDALLIALATSKSRALAALVVTKLDDADMRPSAHLALTTASGLDEPATPSAWATWLETLGPSPEPEK